MIFYLGHKVEGLIDDKLRIARNKQKLWKYGYNEQLDTVIISKDGTLGEIYCVCGLNIGFPQKPDHKEIINWDKTQANQKWVREELPAGLNETTYLYSKYEKYIEDQYRKREEGIWIYLNGKAVYLTGTYWFFIQWFREETNFPNLRIIQNELMLFWEACKADERSYGMIHLKNRRSGVSALGENELLESGTRYENKILGMISKKGNDAKKIFTRMVRAFKRLPPFFKPETDGNSTPKTELVFTEQSRKRKAGEAVTEGTGLDSSIAWHNTEMNAMDGEKIFRSLDDETGKWPPDVPYDEYWRIQKTSHRIGSNIVGKCMSVSTVNAKKKGGAAFEKVWKDSDITERNANGQTKSGLYQIFIDAALCLEGFFDQYGFSIVEDPKEPTLNDLGKMITQGSDTFLKNELEALNDDPEAQNEFRRQFPRNIRDAFRDESSDCSFNLVHLQEQIEHNEFELEDGEQGNTEVERGNFHWKDGIQDSEVIWTPDPVKGRFWIAKNYHPPLDQRNKKIKKANRYDGLLSWAPVNEHVGCFGVDPYNRSKTVDGRGSKGSIHLTTKYNTWGFPHYGCIIEYIDRPEKVQLFYEDVIMVSVYFSMPFLPELSSEKFSTYIYDRGYRNFVLNNPFKLWKDMSDEEKMYGGVPPQDAKIGDQQFYAVEAYVEDHLGVARDSAHRPVGDMGYFPFTRTLMQIKDVDPTKRTKYDAYISFSLSLIGNQKRFNQAPPEDPKPYRSPFRTYDNSGAVSIPR